jgi:hypothetical protein
MILIGDFSERLISSFGAVELGAVRQASILVAGFCIVLPFTLMRHVRSFAAIAIVSALLVFALAAVLLARTATHASTPGLTALPSSMLGSFYALPILVNALSNQTSVLPVFQEILPARRTLAGFTPVLLSTTGLVVLLYGSVGLSGAYLFGTSVTGNVLNSFSAGDPAAFSVRSFRCTGCLGVFSFAILQ